MRKDEEKARKIVLYRRLGPDLPQNEILTTITVKVPDAKFMTRIMTRRTANFIMITNLDPHRTALLLEILAPSWVLSTISTGVKDSYGSSTWVL